jgi:hypothetical protein
LNLYVLDKYTNVIYHSTGHDHLNGSLKPQFITYEDGDSEINHITYSICKYVEAWFYDYLAFERDQNKILLKSRDIYTCFVSVLFSCFCVLSTRDWRSQARFWSHDIQFVEKKSKSRVQISMYSFYMTLLISFWSRSRLDNHKIRLSDTLHIE